MLNRVEARRVFGQARIISQETSYDCDGWVWRAWLIVKGLPMGMMTAPELDGVELFYYDGIQERILLEYRKEKGLAPYKED